MDVEERGGSESKIRECTVRDGECSIVGNKKRV